MSAERSVEDGGASGEGRIDGEANGKDRTDGGGTSDPADGPPLDARPGRDARAERDARPPTLAVVASLVAAAVASLAALLAAPTGGALLAAATVGLLAGSLRRSHRTLSWAAGIGVVGLAVAGYRGGGVEALLVGGVALAVAWDAADHGLSVGAQVGRGARTGRNVAVHAGTTLLAGALSAGVVYGVYLAAAGSQPVAALALLLFGAVALASALR